MRDNNVEKLELTQNDVEATLSHLLKVFPRSGHSGESLKAITPDYLVCLREVRMIAEDLQAAVLRHLGVSSRFPTIRELLQAHEEVCRARKSKASVIDTEGPSPLTEDVLALWSCHVQNGWDVVKGLGRALWAYKLIGADKVFTMDKREAPCGAPQAQWPPCSRTGRRELRGPS